MAIMKKNINVKKLVLSQLAAEKSKRFNIRYIASKLDSLTPDHEEPGFLPSQKAFRRKDAVASASGMTCPMCNGTGKIRRE